MTWPCISTGPHPAHRVEPSADDLASVVARAIIAAAVFIEHDSDAVGGKTRLAMAKLAEACEVVAPGEIERIRKVVSG